ncbi:MAG: hypothetical protein GF387_01400 [Candidatus Portnoybacteria bacterium]|nr:hypothetical protein [Candidatus Portnoybacteria bacterium]
MICFIDSKNLKKTEQKIKKEGFKCKSDKEISMSKGTIPFLLIRNITGEEQKILRRLCEV